MLLNYLPTFKQIEPSNLLGLISGQVVAQVPVKYTAGSKTFGVTTVTKGDYKFFENGILCGFDTDGKTIVDWTDQGAMFIHFTEELNTIYEDRKYFAVEAEEETYLRLVALTPGSEWITDIPKTETAYAAAITAGRIVVVDEDETLPNGTKATLYRCIK